MRLLALTFVALLCAALATWLSQFQGGEVIFHIGETTARASLLMAVLLGIGVFSGFFIVVWTLAYLLSAPGRLHSRYKNLKRNRADRAFARGLRIWLHGDMAQAHTELERAARADPDHPLFHLLAAASGVQANKPKLWDKHLRAITDEPEYAAVATLLRLDGLINSRKWEEALAVLQEMNKDDAVRPRILRHRARCYQELHNWMPLLELSQSKAAQALGDESQQWARSALRPLLAKATAERLDTVWEKLESARNDPKILQLYLQGLQHAKHDQPQLATHLRDRLNAQWDDELLELYAHLPQSDLTPLLKQIDRWLKKNPGHAPLLRAKASVLARQQQWKDALGCLQQAKTHGMNVTLCREIAQVLEQLGEHEAAQQYFRRTVSLLPENSSERPQPLETAHHPAPAKHDA